MTASTASSSRYVPGEVVAKEEQVRPRRGPSPGMCRYSPVGSIGSRSSYVPGGDHSQG